MSAPASTIYVDKLKYKLWVRNLDLLVNVDAEILCINKASTQNGHHKSDKVPHLDYHSVSRKTDRTVKQVVNYPLVCIAHDLGSYNRKRKLSMAEWGVEYCCGEGEDDASGCRPI